MKILNKLTLAQLKKNKSRTFLTGLSIAVIVALLTATAIFISTMWTFLYHVAVSNVGDWHFQTELVSKEKFNTIQTTKDIGSLKNIPVSSVTLVSDNNIDVQVLSTDNTGNDKGAFGAIIDGHWPENNEEVALSYNIPEYKIGQQITLTDGNITKIYKISGFYYNQSSSVFIKQQDFTPNNYIIFGKSNVLNGQYYNVVKEFSNQSNVKITRHNQFLLSLFLITSNESINVIVKTIFPIIIALISLISIVIISSSFSLSLNERLKQLGALSSVGTTKKQLMTMMLLESVWIGTFAIAIGLIIGYVGMAISLPIIDGYAQDIMLGDFKLHITMTIYWPAILCVVLLSAIIIALAALLPSFRASKRSPIDNIKQVPFSKLFKFKNKNTKTKQSILVKLFKHPAFLAKSYQKYNTSRSRIVFVVLTISLMTFNVISSLLLMATRSVEQTANQGYIHNLTTQSSAYVIVFNKYDNDTILEDDIQNVLGVERVYTQKTKIITTTVQEIQMRSSALSLDSNDNLYIATLSKNEEKELLKKANITEEEFKTKGILVSDDISYREKNISALVEGQIKNRSVSSDANSLIIATSIPASKLSFNLISPITLFVSNDTFNKTASIGEYQTVVKYIAIHTNSQNHVEIMSNIKKIPEKLGESDGIYIADIQLVRRSFTSLLNIIQILVYGFVSLISIICLTAFFNTITANVKLRKREFAMLQSIGMTKKQIRTMLSIEHLKAGIYSGITASILSFAIIYHAANLMERTEYIPLLPTQISFIVFIIILIVFNIVTLRQTFKYSIVENIRDESL